jgi:predicted Zn-dependent protease
MRKKSVGNAWRHLLVIATCVFLVLGSVLPKDGFCITVKEEEDLSKAYLKIIFQRYKVIEDQLISNYVSGIGKRLVSALPPQHFTYHFYVVKEDVYNAFATPAGHIFINSGLIAAMESEEELAGILAHEIAHVSCRHISQKIERSKKLQIATLAGVVAGIFLGIGGGGSAASAVTAGSVAAGQSAELAYSREDETQADQIGLDLLEKSGYTGVGLLTMLEKMRSKQWFGSDQIPTYLSTHPASEDRMAYIDTWLEEHGNFSERKENPMFQKAHTLLVGKYLEEDLALKYFDEAVKENPKSDMAHYGYGLALDRVGKPSDAIDQLRTALGYSPFDPYILKDLGRIYFLQGRYADAINVLEGARGLSTPDPDLLFYLGRARLEIGELEPASLVLEELVEKKSSYNEAYYFLGQAYGKMERYGDAHYHLGVYYKKKNELKNALFHLRKALSYTTDPGRLDKIEKMLKKLQEEYKKKKSRPSGRVRRR